MGEPISDKAVFTPSPAAFILYRPQAAEGEVLSYNEEAWRVLSLSLPGGKEDHELSVEICSLCSTWQQLLDGDAATEGKKIGETDIIGVIQSSRRQYAVRGAVLSDPVSISQKKGQYLFILERMSPEKLNLSMIFRSLNLAPREREIVRLLLAGASNKEIAGSLGISLNTVKGYMKLLSRKLGVNGRAGIIATVLAAK